MALTLNDLILTPIYFLIITGIAYWIRPKVTNRHTKKYFIPALMVKLIGAIALGLIYQFYYRGGDTFNYFKHSTQITQAFYDQFDLGIQLLFSNGEYNAETARYTALLYWYDSPTEFFVAKVAGFIGIFAFNTYTVIALFFAFLSFSGMWALYISFLKLYPILQKQFAIAIFFLPSVFFWGSGFLKDSLTIGALGWLFYGFHQVFIEKNNIFKSLIISFLAAYVIYTIKIYVLLSFLPPALFWIFIENNKRIKNVLLRNLLKPIFFGVGGVVAILGATNLTEGNDKYDIDKIGERTQINNEYLTTGVATGSAYNIGTLDGSISSMILVAPQAIIVSLFRPFLWEVRNPIMLLSAIEASIFLYLTIYLLIKTGFLRSLKLISSTPFLSFCFLFSLVLAFAVGTNSGNFGSLVRYKIPLMPFYLSALYILRYYYISLQITKKLKRKA